MWFTKIEKCFFCFTLRTGCLILNILSLIMSAHNALLIIDDWNIIYKISEFSDFDLISMKEIFLFGYIIGAIISIMAIYAIEKVNCFHRDHKIIIIY